MIYISITLGVIASLLAGFQESAEMKEERTVVTVERAKFLQWLWHTLQMYERVAFAVYGASVVYMYAYEDVPLLTIIFSVLFVWSFYWIVYDGLINLALGRGFFVVSTTSGSTIDKLFIKWGFPQWALKLLLLLSSLSLAIFL